MSETDERSQEEEGRPTPRGSLVESLLRISSNLSLADALVAVAEEARGLTSSGHAAVYIAGEESRLFTAGISTEGFLEGYSLEPGQQLQAFLGHSESAQSETVPGGTLRSYIYSNDALLGTIIVGDKIAGGNYTDDDSEILRFLAIHSASVVVNATSLLRELRENARLEASIHEAPIGVFVFSAESSILISINAEGSRLTQGAMEPGMSVSQFCDLVPPRRLDGREMNAELHPLNQAMAGAVQVSPALFQVDFPEGHSAPALISVNPVFSPDGHPSSYVVFVQNSTLLIGLDYLRTELVGAVGNALRKPLTTMKGSTTTALTAAFPPDQEEARLLFRLVDEQLDSMRRLINDFTDLIKMESGGLPLRPVPTDFAAVLEEALDVVRENHRRVTPAVELENGLPAITADRDRIVQVLAYLFLKMSTDKPDTATIRISAALEGAFVRASFCIEGKQGAAEEFSRQLEWSSFASMGEMEQDFDLADLSLPICKGIVSAHGGMIWVEEGKKQADAQINLTLPAAIPSCDVQGEQHREQNPVVEGDATAVLVVSLNNQLVAQVADTLSGAGYNAFIAINSQQAEQNAITHGPDLILLDVSLPMTEGVGVIRRIREILDSPIVFLSGQNGDQDIARAFEMGAYDYISRPFSPAELLGRVNAAMQNRASSSDKQITTYVQGELSINYAERRVVVAGQQLKLTATEYRLLSELSLNAGRVLTNPQLLQRVWGEQSAEDTRILRTFVKNLRRKLGDDAQTPRYIFTEPRVGYRMERPGGTD